MNKKELINEIMWLAEFNSGGAEDERINAVKYAEELFDNYIDNGHGYILVPFFTAWNYSRCYASALARGWLVSKLFFLFFLGRDFFIFFFTC